MQSLGLGMMLRALGMDQGQWVKEVDGILILANREGLKKEWIVGNLEKEGGKLLESLFSWNSWCWRYLLIVRKPCKISMLSRGVKDSSFYMSLTGSCIP